MAKRTLITAKRNCAPSCPPRANRDLSAELEAIDPKIAKLTTEWEKAAEEVEKVAAAG